MDRISEEEALKDAKAFLQQGELASKKTWYHPPDFVEASSAYSRAGAGFLKLGRFNEAQEAFEKAAQAYDHDGVVSKCGECLGLAAKAALERNCGDEVFRLVQESKAKYLEGDQPLQAIRVLLDVAEQSRSLDLKIWGELYDAVVEVIESCQQYLCHRDFFVTSALLWLELEDYGRCLSAWDWAKHAFLYLKDYDNASSCACARIAISLSTGDIGAAEGFFDAESRENYFVRSSVYEMIHCVLDGVTHHDGKVLERGQKHCALRFLKPEIGRIICGLDARKKVSGDPDETDEDPDLW
jgi:tetratricopeptide (TPR) repeat protein